MDFFDCCKEGIILYVPTNSKTKVGKVYLPKDPRELMKVFRKEGFDMF